MSNFERVLEQANKIRLLIKKNQEKEIIPSLYESYKKLLEILNTSSKYKDNFLIQDIDDFFRSYPFYNRKSIFKMSKKEFSVVIKEYLDREQKDYFYYFRVNRVYQFVKNGKIGDGILIKFENLPKVVKNRIEKNYEHENVNDAPRFLSKEQYEQYRKNDYYMLIKIKTRGRSNSEQLAIKLLKKNTAIFNFFTRDYFREEEEIANIFVCTDSKDKWLGEYYGNFETKTPYRKAFHVEYIPMINQILSKTKKNEIENNILKVINMVGQTTNNPTLEVRFLFTLIAIETLLASERQDYLNWRMSERLAFLLADNKSWVAYYKKIPESSSKFEKLTPRFIKRHLSESRAELFETAKELYDKRSSLAHLNGKKQTVTEKDYVLARFLLFSLTIKFLELLKIGITRYTRKTKDDPNSLIDYVERMKFE